MIFNHFSTAFSKNGRPTIISKEGVTGFGEGVQSMTADDVEQLRGHYGCDNGGIFGK